MMPYDELLKFCESYEAWHLGRDEESEHVEIQGQPESACYLHGLWLLAWSPTARQVERVGCFDMLYIESR